MKKVAVVIIVFFALLQYAQGQRILSFPFSAKYDEEAAIAIGMQYNFGFQSYQINLKNNWQSAYPIDYPEDDIAYLGELRSISSRTSHLISVGIPIDVRAHANLYFNTTPSFVFANGLGIKYQSLDPQIADITRQQKHIVSSNIGSGFNAFEIPFTIKYRSDEKKVNRQSDYRYRGYLIAGARLTKWAGLQKEFNKIQGLKNSNQAYPDNLIHHSQYLSWEAGMGVDIFFPYFRISPELKFNQSFGNVLDVNHSLAQNNKFMAPIERAYIRNIYLSLTFQ